MTNLMPENRKMYLEVVRRAKLLDVDGNLISYFVLLDAYFVSDPKLFIKYYSDYLTETKSEVKCDTQNRAIKYMNLMIKGKVDKSENSVASVILNKSENSVASVTLNKSMNSVSIVKPNKSEDSETKVKPNKSENRDARVTQDLQECISLTKVQSNVSCPVFNLRSGRFSKCDYLRARRKTVEMNKDEETSEALSIENVNKETQASCMLPKPVSDDLGTYRATDNKDEVKSQNTFGSGWWVKNKKYLSTKSKEIDEVKLKDKLKQKDKSKQGDNTKQRDKSKQGDTTKQGDSIKQEDNSKQADTIKHGNNIKQGDKPKQGDKSKQGDNNMKVDRSKQADKSKQVNSPKQRNDQISDDIKASSTNSRNDKSVNVGGEQERDRCTNKNNNRTHASSRQVKNKSDSETFGAGWWQGNVTKHSVRPVSQPAKNRTSGHLNSEVSQQLQDNARNNTASVSGASNTSTSRNSTSASSTTTRLTNNNTSTAKKSASSANSSTRSVSNSTRSVSNSTSSVSSSTNSVSNSTSSASNSTSSASNSAANLETSRNSESSNFGLSWWKHQVTDNSKRKVNSPESNTDQVPPKVDKVKCVDEPSRQNTTSYTGNNCRDVVLYDNSRTLGLILKFAKVAFSLKTSFLAREAIHGRSVVMELIHIPGLWRASLGGSHITLVAEIVTLVSTRSEVQAITIRDKYGHQAFVILNTMASAEYSIPESPGLVSMPISECLEPGNFIVLRAVKWEELEDGELYIDVVDMKNVSFLFFNL